jgi:phosphatidylglycerophosphate synthase
MQETLKSADTEEFIDIHFYRPIGYRSALLFRRAGASPNTVTIIGILLGIAAGICFYYQSIYINITGMALLILANTCDSADGQLARMTGKTSAMGRMLDGFCGDLWFASIYIALTLRLWPDYGLWTLAMTLPAAYSHTIQAAMADYYRNAHLHFLKGKATSELSDYEALLDDYRTRKHSYPTTFHRLAYLLYLNYTCAQQRMAPKFQKLMSALQYSYDDSDPPLHFRKAFRRRSLPLMKYANMLSFNTRAIALFISISINKPWLYLAFELTALNIMLIYMVATHERFSARLTEEL